MALLVLEGVYQDGKVELKERPEGVERARVVVTLLPDLVETEAEERERARQEAVERMLARMRAGIEVW